MSDNEKIFVNIASYRDPELLPTIRDCIRKADHPENLVFAIAWQRNKEDEWETLEELVDDSRFKIIDIDYKDSLGACWARSLAQKKYKDEKYTLLMDSHHRFVRSWDTKCKNMISQLQNDGYEKPLLTAYLPSYDPANDPSARVQDVWKLNFDRFTPEGVIFMIPSLMENWQDKTAPVSTRFLSAHFTFTLGQWNKEVLYDPNLYFHGEEITLAVRSFTHGYDLFTPHRILAWHEYTRKGRVRHWDENGNWNEVNRKSLLRTKKLLGVDGIKNDIKFGKFGLGKKRTKKDYERFAGIRFKDRGVQKYTLRYFESPNSTYATEEAYNKSFINRYKHCVDVYKKNIPDDKEWDGWVVSFETHNGKVIHRADALKGEIDQIKNNPTTIDGDFYNIWREFETKVLPDVCIVWPYTLNDEWGPRIEVKIPKIE